MQMTEAESAAAKHILREMRPPLRTHAEAMHQLDANAESQLATLFGAAPTPIDEAAANRIAQDADLLMQEWQQAMATFTELRDAALRRFPELGPLFEPVGGRVQQERVAEEGTAEQGAEASEGMEVETVICD